MRAPLLLLAPALLFTALFTACSDGPETPAADAPETTVTGGTEAPPTSPADAEMASTTLAGPENSAAMCALMTEDVVQGALAGATNIATKEMAGVGTVGCRGTLDLDGTNHAFSVTYQADATDAEGFARIQNQVATMANSVDGMEPPTAVEGLGTAAFVHRGTGGNARVLVGEGLWMSSVTQGPENDADRSLALLRAVLEAAGAV